MKYITALSAALFASAASAQQSAYGQCGGTGWSGSTTCISGYYCSTINSYYSQCMPGAASTTPAPNPTPAPTKSKTKTGTKTGTKTKTSSGGGTNPTTPATGKVEFAGVNIAGFDFGCGTDGTCNISAIYPAPNAAGQMSHFAKDDNLNIFRLPVGWQYLVDNVLGGPLNSANMARYDTQVQACLATGAHCIIDIHNYARWDGQIVGQGGPTDAQLANLWSQLATKYASQSNIIFGIMNEPHDLPSITTWATTVQASVTAIRKAGATSQLILLPGNNYTSAEEFVSNGSLAALQTVTNPDGTTKNLIFDVHKYLDADNSGTNTECVTDNVSSTFEPLAGSLRSINRQALLSETGGGNVQSCVTDLCSEIAYLNANSDVYLGYIGWAAGGFDDTYNLSETPTQNGNTWTDTLLVSSCIKR